MKKACFLIFSLCFVLLVFSGCNQSAQAQAYEKGLEIIAMMDEIAESDIARQLYSTGEDVTAIVAEAGKGDYLKPSAVYEIAITRDTFFAMGAISDFNKLSPELQDYMLKQTAASLASYSNAKAGVNTVTAAATCTVHRVFEIDDLEDDTIYLYVFENGVPALISFEKGEGKSVYAYGTFILNGDFPSESKEEIEEYFSTIGAAAKKIK